MDRWPAPHSSEEPPFLPLAADPGAAAVRQSRRMGVCRAMLVRKTIIERMIGDVVSARADLAMLLYVYLAELEGREPYLYEVCTMTNIPLSTAHRKVARLVEENILHRSPMVVDRRRVGLRLTVSTRDLIERLLDRLTEQPDAADATA